MSEEHPPSLAEKYQTARETSNMRVTVAPCPADMILSAAFAGEPDGALFTRLRGEFDQAHAEVARETAGANIGFTNERMLVRLRLKSLKAAKVALLTIADHRATRWGLTFPAEVMPELTWQALSAWMDPRCGHCQGRGFNGGYDGPRLTCRKCDAGNRRGYVGKTDAERGFVSGLVGDIEEAMSRFEQGMGRARRG